MAELSEAYSIKIRAGFLITAIAAIVSFVSIFVTMRNDLLSAIGQLDRQQKVLESNQLTIMELQNEMRAVRNDLERHVGRYEKDMDRYVRERPGR